MPSLPISYNGQGMPDGIYQLPSTEIVTPTIIRAYNPPIEIGGVWTNYNEHDYGFQQITLEGNLDEPFSVSGTSHAREGKVTASRGFEALMQGVAQALGMPTNSRYGSDNPGNTHLNGYEEGSHPAHS